jgi:KaiC/GvpD/RAD55 family RecA-like ATPase
MSTQENLPASARKLPTGIPGLDSLIDGGFTDGRIVLVLGEPGTGKTIFCSQFLHYGATEKDEKGVFIGMNEPQNRFMSEMAALGMDFQGLEKQGKFAYIDATEVRRIPEQATVGRIPVGGRELSLVNLIDMIQDGIQKLAPKRVVIDSISDLVFRYPAVDERRPVVLDIVETLGATQATCLMTSELNSTGTDRVLQPEEYLAEGVVLLRTMRGGTRTIQISKMRGSKVDIKPRPYSIKDKGIEIYATEEVYDQSR